MEENNKKNNEINNSNLTNEEKISNEKEINNEEKNKQQENKEKKHPIFKVMYTITKSIMFVIIFVLFVLITLSATSKTRDVFGFRLYIILSGSMEPTIHVKDAIITKTKTNYNTGDVIAFATGSETTVHRVINIYEKDGKKLFETQGDANNVKDGELVEEQNIKGQYLFSVPFLGAATLYMQSHINVLIIVIGVLIVSIIMISVIKELRNK